MNLNAVDLWAEKIRVDYQVPGLALAIVKEDSLYYASGYGLRAVDEDEPVDIHTRFGIASISKSFTAMALGILVDEGLLAWSDPVTQFIPTFQMESPFATSEFTVLDLLVHRSGLPEVAGGTLWYGSDLSREQVVAGMRHLRPVSSFRSQYAYQNITYLVAGQIIPAVTGLSWDDFVRERIFIPLAMHNSNTSINAHGRYTNIAQPHIQLRGELERVTLRNYDNVGPAASINTTAVDLSAYARLLLSGGRFDGQQIYSAQIAADLWTPRTLIPINTQAPGSLKYFTPKFLNTYALGWVIQDLPHRAQIKVSHSGGIDGLRSLLTLIPAEKLGIIVLVNNESPAHAIMTQYILDQYWHVQDNDWYKPVLKEYEEMRRKSDVDPQVEPVAGTSPSQALSGYTGKYHSQLIGDIEIKQNGPQLTLHFPHTPSFTAQLSHWHFDTFRLTWQDPMVPNGLVTFVLNSSGSVEEMRLDQPNLLDVDFSEIHPLVRQR